MYEYTKQDKETISKLILSNLYHIGKSNYAVDWRSVHSDLLKANLPGLSKASSISGMTGTYWDWNDIGIDYYWPRDQRNYIVTLVSERGIHEEEYM